MRRLHKLEAPGVLVDNADDWSCAFAADPTSESKRRRYRHPDIKGRLREETSYKCIYCESKIGHNTPGDVEHKIPTSVDASRHFEWSNLTIACTECNRRKNDYFNEDLPFLDPYVDDVEQRVVHHGPVVSWAIGDHVAEISVRTLGLHDDSRLPLILRKIEKISEVNELMERRNAAVHPALAGLLTSRLDEMQQSTSEYSGMVRAVCQAAG